MGEVERIPPLLSQAFSTLTGRKGGHKAPRPMTETLE